MIRAHNRVFEWFMLGMFIGLSRNPLSSFELEIADCITITCFSYRKLIKNLQLTVRASLNFIDMVILKY